MKKQPEVTAHIPDDILKKILYISDAEHRTLNNHILLLMRNNIQYYEKTHGKITPEQTKNIDLTPYEAESEDSNG